MCEECAPVSQHAVRPCGVRQILRSSPSAAGSLLLIADWDWDLAVLAGSGWLLAGLLAGWLADCER